MADFKIYEELEVTATPGTLTCDVTAGISQYEIITTGTVTIGGTTSINTSGTVVEGHVLRFRFSGDIAGGTLDVLGTNVPTELLTKKWYAEAYYDGSAWVVAYNPDINQTAIIPPTSLSSKSLTQVDSIYSTSSTINTSGQQLLDSMVIPADTFDTDGQSFTVKLWGQCTSTAAELKTIDVEVVTGAVTRTLYTNALVTDIVGKWTLEVNVVVEPTIGAISPSGTLMCNANGAIDVDAYTTLVKPLGYDETVTQTINIYGTETTPSGNQISLIGGILTVN